MVKALTRTVFVGTFRHSVDEKNRVAIPAKWRAAASGSHEFYVLPDPKNCLVVLPESAMARMLERADDISIGEYERRDVLRMIGAKAHGTPCDKQGRVTLTAELLTHAASVGMPSWWGFSISSKSGRPRGWRRWSKTPPRTSRKRRSN